PGKNRKSSSNNGGEAVSATATPVKPAAERAAKPVVPEVVSVVVSPSTTTVFPPVDAPVSPTMSSARLSALLPRRHDMWEQSLRQLDDTAKAINLDPSAHEVLRHCKRTLEVAVPVRMDNGELH